MPSDDVTARLSGRRVFGAAHFSSLAVARVKPAATLAQSLTRLGVQPVTHGGTDRAAGCDHSQTLSYSLGDKVVYRNDKLFFFFLASVL